AVLPRRVGVHEGGDLQAAGGGAHHRLVLRVQGTQHRPHRDGRAAARAHSVAAGQAVLFHQVFFQTICHDCFPSLFPDVQVAIGLAHLAGGRDLLQLREHVLNALHPHVAAAQAVDVVDALGAADARRVQAGRDLREHGAAVGVEAVVLVHHGEGLHVLQGFADILTGEGTEGADLDLAHLLALGPQLVDGLLGGAGGGADDDDGLLSVVHHIGLDQAVGPAGHLAEFLAHLADHVLGVHHGLGLLPLGLHVVHGRGVG
ncbi:triose-phosphate isomerase, partial [Dysosmobacter welbionis]